MRKVRVWDDVLKEMLYSRVEQFDDMLGFRFEKHLETENPIYMWSTGLKDRNGKEIYGGDIIEFDKWMPNETFVRVIRGEVYWSDKGYWAVRNKDGKFLEFLGRTENPEQIGNIYEHPHLLKGDGNE